MKSSGVLPVLLQIVSSAASGMSPKTDTTLIKAKNDHVTDDCLGHFLKNLSVPP